MLPSLPSIPGDRERRIASSVRHVAWNEERQWQINRLARVTSRSAPRDRRLAKAYDGLARIVAAAFDVAALLVSHLGWQNLIFPPTLRQSSMHRNVYLAIQVSRYIHGISSPLTETGCGLMRDKPRISVMIRFPVLHRLAARCTTMSNHFLSRNSFGERSSSFFFLFFFLPPV